MTKRSIEISNSEILHMMQTHPEKFRDLDASENYRLSTRVSNEPYKTYMMVYNKLDAICDYLLRDNPELNLSKDAINKHLTFLRKLKNEMLPDINKFNRSDNVRKFKNGSLEFYNEFVKCITTCNKVYDILIYNYETKTYGIFEIPEIPKF